MSTDAGLWFVYRSHYEGPLSKRVVRLSAPSLLSWFQQRIGSARDVGEPEAMVEKELGGYVYGFRTVFEAVKKHRLAPPPSIAALKRFLHEHLYVEGGKDHVRLDEHSLRVVTDDDEVQLAYFFFDDEAVRLHPDRLAYLLHTEPSLPAVPPEAAAGPASADKAFVPPIEPTVLRPAGDGEGATYACLLTFYDGESLPGQAAVFPGVRLSGLAKHMLRVVPDARQEKGSESVRTWPLELRLLRAMLEPGEEGIDAALLRCTRFPLDHLGSKTLHTRLGIGPQATAREELQAAAGDAQPGGDPEKTLLHVGEHAVLLCAHTLPSFGYQQWVFFDDIWAAAHPHLAASLLRYARGWDPLPYRAGRPAPTKEEAASRQRKREATAQERAYDEARRGREDGVARQYRPQEQFRTGEMLAHEKFGIGVVQRVEQGKVDVLFRDAQRVLVHGRPPVPAG